MKTIESKVKKFYQPDDPMWVVGCIDSYGAIIGREVSDDGDIMHRKEESKGRRWRWNIWGQEFHATRNPTLDRLSQEEFEAVSDWLERRGYKKAD